MSQGGYGCVGRGLNWVIWRKAVVFGVFWWVFCCIWGVWLVFGYLGMIG
jgi:hypothetical protein